MKRLIIILAAYVIFVLLGGIAFSAIPVKSLHGTDKNERSFFIFTLKMEGCTG